MIARPSPYTDTRMSDDKVPITHRRTVGQGFEKAYLTLSLGYASLRREVKSLGSKHMQSPAHQLGCLGGKTKPAIILR